MTASDTCLRRLPGERALFEVSPAENQECLFSMFVATKTEYFLRRRYNSLQTWVAKNAKSKTESCNVKKQGGHSHMVSTCSWSDLTSLLYTVCKYTPIPLYHKLYIFLHCKITCITFAENLQESKQLLDGTKQFRHENSLFFSQCCNKLTPFTGIETCYVF